jgi:hypothetical protein
VSSKATVQLEGFPDRKFLGVHVTELSLPARRLIWAERLTPFKLAVTVAVPLALSVPVETVNVLLLWPEGTVTLDGVESCAVLSASDTSILPLAFPVSVAVQVAD